MPEQQWIFAHIFIIIIKRIKSRGGRRCCTIPIRVSWLWENCNSNTVGTSLLHRSFADGRCRYLIINNHTTRRMGMGGISPPPQAPKCWSGYLCCYGNALSIFFCVVELIISTGEKVAILSNTHLGRFNYFIVGLHNLARLIKFMGRWHSVNVHPLDVDSLFGLFTLFFIGCILRWMQKRMLFLFYIQVIKTWISSWKPHNSYPWEGQLPERSHFHFAHKQICIISDKDSSASLSNGEAIFHPDD